jgi:putative CocE/NonD family hydrolase
MLDVYSDDMPVSPLLRTGPVARRRPFADVPDDARQYAVRMRDGVLLASDVYLPRRGHRWPVLVARTPYDKAGEECFLPLVARWFTEHGYAVVVQDVRGKVRSAGDLQPFHHEVTDGYDTLDWVIAQSWCNGAVGMIGDSYYGFTQWAAAASGHPALRAITPRVTVPDFAEMLHPQGVLPLEVVACWGLETWVDEALYDYEGQLDWSIRPLSDIVPAALGGRRPVRLDAWATGRLEDTARLQVRGDIPALHLAGFWDFMRGGQIACWQQLSRTGSAPQYLIIDAVDHGWTQLRQPGTPYEDPWQDAITAARFLHHYLQPLLPFYDRFLKDKGAYDVAPVRWHQAHDAWYEDTQWPPSGARPSTWFLTGTDPAPGRLSGRAEPVTTTASWTHDPLHPVRSTVHPYYPLIDPAQERLDTPADDILTFVGEQLHTPLDLAGPVELTASVTSSGPSTHVIATLFDVHPDGTAHPVLDAAAAAHAPWPQPLTVNLGDTGYRLQVGHRLGLKLSSSSFPRYVLHPGTDQNPWSAIDVRSTEQTMVLGGPDSARLTCYVRSDQGKAR